jgi:V/A-type H+-transporting ATPase subunit I
MALKAYMLIRDKKIWDAVFDVGSWYIVFIGAICLISPYTKGFGGYISLFGLVMVVLTQGRHEKGIAKKLITGILSLYDITAYLSDVLSYSRLLALGLATGVIGMVINIMGSLGGKSIVGYIVLLVVFIAGHTFNMAINILGSYVHSGRLMYIEFFGKFFESGGKSFHPLSLNCKYSKIIK